ncbi:MAG: Crp/Fnr family transcriptional regulator [Acidobacteriota bacterium]
MAKPSPTTRGKPGPRNHLLASLPSKDFKRIEPFLQPIRFDIRQSLHEPGKPITDVYFPLNGVASIVTTMEDGSTVEAATVGNEGMVGLPMFIETGTVSLEAFVQVAGQALRMKASAFRNEIKNGGPLFEIIQHYTQTLLRLIAQSAACNRLHTLRQRCARWLLMTHDRVDGDQFFLTQEFLSMMLGVRRATVTVAAGELRQEGLIRYSQGRIEILDREGLEGASCECYMVIRREFDRLASLGAN